MTSKARDKDKKLYTVGEVSKICNVSRKTLRFYDKIGLISPDYISEETGYRYYSEETVLFVPVVKYFKQMGFKLEEMKAFLQGSDYQVHAEGFRNQLDSLMKMREDINIAVRSVSDWYNLIREAQSVIESNAVEVSIKFVDFLTAPYKDFEFNGNYMASIINIGWTNYLEEIGQAITGAVMIKFDNMEEKLSGEPTNAQIFQVGVRDISDNNTLVVGGEMMISAYHIGEHEKIGETYDKIFKWAKMHGYEVGAYSIERYITDYWTIMKPDEFVTEVLVSIK